MKRAGAAAAFLVPAAAVVALLWPLPIHLGARFVPAAFFHAHAWAADLAWRSLGSGTGLSPSAEGGYPWLRQVRLIGWVPILATFPLRPWLGALGAMQLVELLSLPATGLAAWCLLRRWTGAGSWTAAGAACAYALSPYMLGTLAIGELPKLQGWFLPIFLLAFDAALSGRPWALAGTALAAGASAFTSPYYGLVLPLLVLGQAPAAWPGRRRWLAAAVATAAGLLPALLYYGSSRPEVRGSLFRPAPRFTRGDLLPWPHPVASLADLVGWAAHTPRSAWETFHVPSLGLPLLAAGIAGAVLARRRPGWRSGISLALLGTTLALGPRLALRDELTPLRMPVALLEALHWPTAAGGMYFRYVLVADLGLALLLAALASRFRGGALLTWGVAALGLLRGLPASGPWPRPVLPIPGRDLLLSMRGDDGAVLHLPIPSAGDPVSGQWALLAATLHGRPTTGTPNELQHFEAQGLSRLVERDLARPDPAAALRAEGFRYVLWMPERAPAAGLPRHLAERLGPPRRDGYVLAWDLGPTTENPRPPRAGRGRRRR